MDVEVLGRAALGMAVDVVAAGAILVVGWTVAGWTSRLVGRSAEKNAHLDRTIASVLIRLVRWGIIAFTVIAVLGRFGIQTTSLVALLGAAGLAVGLALQGALSNVAAGVMILGLRPFRLGDVVDIGGTFGTVDEIGLFSTRLEMFDGVVVHQPNTNIWGTEIKNYSQAKLRRVDVAVGVGYGVDLGRAMEVARGMLDEETRILGDPEPFVAVESLGDDAVGLMVRGWTAPADYFVTKLDLTRRIKERFDQEKIGIPYPQRDLHLIQDGPIDVRNVS